MITDAMKQNRINVLYETAAKPLFQVALYSVGNRSVAEDSAEMAILGAFRDGPDVSDPGAFLKRCLGKLYRCVKEARSESIKTGADDAQAKPLGQMLAPLSFDERYILLLFCRQKYSIGQIAEITGLQEFIVEKRLTSAAGLANSIAGDNN
jgi:DNA-directed RNA polymerase specialized sigma24 family protein